MHSGDGLAVTSRVNADASDFYGRKTATVDNHPPKCNAHRAKQPPPATIARTLTSPSHCDRLSTPSATPPCVLASAASLCDIFKDEILSLMPSVRARRVYSYIDLFRSIYKCNTYPFSWNVGLDYRWLGASRAGSHRPRQTVRVHRREVSTSRASFVVSTCARERRARRPWRRRCARRWRCRIRNV